MNLPRYYEPIQNSSVNSENTVPVTERTSLYSTIISDPVAYVRCQVCYHKILEICYILLVVLLWCIIVIFSIYLVAIFIGIIVVILNSTFETTIVFLFGKAIYQKNFPVCSDTKYTINGCYTTTNTYC
jgi:hypothetical protein